MTKIDRRNFLKAGSLFTMGLPFLSTGDAIDDLRKIGNENLSKKALYTSFKNPDSKYRPFVRWWWNGNRVRKEELIRELEILKQAGIGGVEINPIRFPGDTDTLDIEPLEYLSDEWIEVLKTTLTEARKRGIFCDMIVGSGWPFGGAFLKREEQTKIVALGTLDLEGGREYEWKKEELLDRVQPPIMSPHKDVLKELVAIRLAPKKLNSLSDCIDYDEWIDKERISITLPEEGEYVLYFLVKLTGFMAVINGAPGADGPVLDHYNKKAVQHYLDRISGKLSEKIGPLKQYFRAFFTDSFELEGANWCEDMFDEFEKRKGYDLNPYFPFILFKTGHMGEALNESYGSDFSRAFNETVEGVRYDFEEVRLQLFKERFIDTFTNWCRTQGVQSRMQAYGRPCNPLEASMHLDIPECETWLRTQLGNSFSDRHYSDGRAYSMSNKFVSSAANLAGKQIVSCEEITNTDIVFNASLDTLKIAGDQSILSGVTHSVFHGFNYSPPEAPFPGWIRYGTFLNERNTWWKFFKNWTDYKARLYAVLQNARMQTDIAILPPLADLSGKFGFQRDPFPAFSYPKYLYQIWESVHQNGNGCDYITEGIIGQSKIKRGTLTFGDRSYKALILVDMDSMLPETATKLAQFRSQGGKLIFVERVPSKTPGKNGKTTALDLSGLKITDRDIFPAPKEDMISWYKNMQSAYELTPYVKIKNPNKFVNQVYYKKGALDIFFFSNYNSGVSHNLQVEFEMQNKKAWIWNPESGERFICPDVDASGKMAIRLGPSESRFIVLDKKKDGPRRSVPNVESLRPVEIRGTWRITTKNMEEKEDTFSMGKLVDFSKDEDLKTFGGTITYKNSFDLLKTGRGIFLDLGEFYGVAEIFVNTKKVDTIWYGSPMVDLSAVVKKGNNDLTIRLTTTLGNHMKSLKDNKIAQNWTQGQSYNSTGLLGPVNILK